MTNIKCLGKITLDELNADVKWLEERKCGCCFHTVGKTDAGTVLAIVVGWGNGFEEAEPNTPMADGTYRICAKVAYQGANNMCQCDYEGDWYMPYDLESGEVDDTDTEVVLTKGFVSDLNQTAKRVWKDWRKDLDKMTP